MWENQKLRNFISEGVSEEVIKGLDEDCFLEKSFPPRIGSAPEKAYQILSCLYADLQEAGLQQKSQELASTLSRQVSEVVRMIAEQKQWQLVADLWAVTDSLGLLPDQRFFRFGTFVVRLIHILVGDEKNFLIGTRNNQALWCPYHIPEHKFSVATLVEMFPVDTIVQYFDRNDLDVLPSANEWAHEDELPSLPLIHDCWAEIAALLEHAYYNQQFIPHHVGSYVKLKGVPGLDSMTLKVKRGLKDRNFVDLIAIFKLGDKKLVIVLDGSRGIQGSDEDLGELVELGSLAIESNEIRFLFWLTALVYHDLVTAKDAQPNQIRRPNNAMTKQDSPDTQEIGWIYIPRKVSKQGLLPPRLPSSKQRSMAPHRVRGHKRVGNMTDAQRDRIMEFEKETDLDVLRWLPDGFTFVRPHISPKEESDSIAGLPQFIRVRIQQDLKRLLSDPVMRN